jgi:hypothetical protein
MGCQCCRHGNVDTPALLTKSPKPRLRAAGGGRQKNVREALGRHQQRDQREPPLPRCYRRPGQFRCTASVIRTGTVASQLSGRHGAHRSASVRRALIHRPPFHYRRVVSACHVFVDDEGHLFATALGS